MTYLRTHLVRIPFFVFTSLCQNTHRQPDDKLAESFDWLVDLGALQNQQCWFILEQEQTQNVFTLLLLLVGVVRGTITISIIIIAINVKVF